MLRIIDELAAKFLAEAGHLFTLKRAAGLVGFGRDTLSRAIAAGELRVSRPGGNRILVTPRRLAEWVARGERR